MIPVLRDIAADHVADVIDFDLPYTHRMSFTADHIDPRGLGGKLLGEIRPAHRACNSSRGKRRTIEAIPKPVTTRAW